MTNSRFTNFSLHKNKLLFIARTSIVCLGVTASLLAIPAWSQPTAPATPTTTIAAPSTPETRWAKELAAFGESDKKQMPPQNAVLFIGSSSIRVWKTLDTDFPGVPVINRGFGGSVISDSVALAPRLVWPYQPRAIVFYAGDNDLAGKKTPERVLADYQAFVRVVREKVPSAPIAFISIKPSPSRAALMPVSQKANSLIATWIFAQGPDAHLSYIDVWTAMTTPQNRPRPELFGPDMLHMNRKGYEIWTKIVMPFVAQAK